MREIVVPAGQRTRILWLYSSSIPGSVRFRAEPVDGGEPTGTVELERRRWFTWHREEHPLRPRTVLAKGFADPDYRVHVTPGQDCRIIFESRHFRGETLFMLLGGLLVLGVLAGLFTLILSAL